MCDAFGVPLVVLVDVPGYLPGVGQEWDGVVRRGAKLLHAFGECVVPRVTLVTRKTYGGAYIAMNSRALGATRVFAWPGAEVAVMGAGGRDPDPAPPQAGRGRPDIRPQVEAELAAEHERIAGGVDKARRDRRRRRGRRAHAHPHRPSRRPSTTRSSATACAAARTATSRSEGGRLASGALRRSLRPCRSGFAGSARPRSDHLVQPADRGALAGVPERLELVVPGLAEQLVDLAAAGSVSPRAALTTAALSRSSGIMMSPCRPVTAWKTPRSGV